MFGKTADKTKSCCVGDSCTGIKAVESLKKFHAAEMAKLQGQIDALKDATLHEEPEKPMRTWKVTTNDGQKHKVTAQQYVRYDDIFASGTRFPPASSVLLRGHSVGRTSTARCGTRPWRSSCTSPASSK